MRAHLWRVGGLVAAGIVALPVFTVLGSLLFPSGETWAHLRATVLPDYLANTALLMLGVGVLAGVIGVGTAWVVATKEFPGRRWLTWALALPLAAPAYVIAYVYTDLLEYAGPVQSALREVTGWQAGDYSFPPVRSLGGATVMLALVLYPYVYLLARTAFTTQAAAMFEAARVLGASPRRAFYSIALPAARPAIAGGLALVLMETVADYGVVDYFGVATFTTGIFRTWFALGDRDAAMQLAGLLFLLVAVLVVAEHYGRRGRFDNPVSRNAPPPRETLKGHRALFAVALCLAPVVLGFAVPFAALAHYAFTVGDPLLGRSFADFVQASFGVAGVTAVLAAGLALWLVSAQRASSGPVTRFSVRMATLGYALPGAMLAVGLLVPLTAFDKSVAGYLARNFDMQVGLLLTGTAAALVFAYLARFLTVAYNSCHAGMERVHQNLDAVARSLGATPGRVLREIHTPLMRGAVATALLLVFIDVLKELPATLILRPFNFETLATRVYRLASDERLAEASTAALAIVAMGTLPALLLVRGTAEPRPVGAAHAAPVSGSVAPK